MRGGPKISVVMPVYNAQKYVGLAIESILSQTFKNFEFIIINDASTDETLSICEKFAKKDPRIRIITNKKNLNIGDSLNVGIKAARAEYVARMDGDDISLPKRLDQQFRYLERNTNVAVVGCGMKVIDEVGKEIGTRKYSSDSTKLKKSIFRYSPFAHPTTMFRKKAIIDAGLYSSAWSPTEDLHLWVRVGTKWDFSNLKNVLFKYRVYSDSQSNKNIRKVEMKVLKIRWEAFTKYGYVPSVFDFFYNTLQLVTIFLMPVKFRYELFNFFRNKGLI